VGAIYKYILKKHFFRLILAILPKMLRFYNVKNVIETLFYPRRSDDNLSSIEILAIVVDERTRKMGLGRKLIEQVLGESNRRRIERIKVMVGEPLPAN
jgi:ribosomal protein S18 acetylase RimI-like enzyme